MNLERLDIHHGDVLVWRTNVSVTQVDRATEALQALLEQQGIDDVILIVLRPGESLRAIDAETMYLMGWVRP